MTYDSGDGSRLGVTFTDYVTGLVADPTTIILKVRPPRADTVTYTYGLETVIVRDSVGIYHADISITASGRWQFKWFGTGALVAAEQGTLFVRQAAV